MGLKERILASLIAIAPIPSCQTLPEPVPQEQARQPTILEDALNYFYAEKYGKVQGLIEQHKKEKYKENETLPPSLQCILAITYAASRRFDEAETELRNLMTKFEKTPEIIHTIRTELNDFFTTEQYKKLETQLQTATIIAPKLNIVLGFLKMTQKEYNKAAELYKKGKNYFKDYEIRPHRQAIGQLKEQAPENEKEGYDKIFKTLLGL